MPAVSFDVPQDLFDESLRRLRGAGAPEPEKLLNSALEASAVDALQVIGGKGPVPTALSDVRAARLFELCKLRTEILADEVVAVLFRVMPSTATAVTRRMQATYEADLEDSLKAHMIAVAKLTSPRKDADEKAKRRVAFATTAAFSYALRTIAARGLIGEVTVEQSARAIEFPKEIEIKSGKKTEKVSIAKDVLGIE